MPCLYKAPSRKTISQREFPYPASGLTNAVMNSAEYVSDLTPLFIGLRDKVEHVIVKKKSIKVKKKKLNCNPNYIRFIFIANRPIV
jgi:hypothetical protein